MKNKILIAGLLVIAIFIGFIASNRAIPILMYHSISKTEDKANILGINKDIFKWQMEYLQKHNYRVVSLKTAGDMIMQGKKIPPRSVVLTFDDGHRDFYTEAYPVIKKYKFNVAIFPTVYNTEAGNDYMNWAELNNLKEGGLVDIGSHGLCHQSLTRIPLLQAKEQIIASKAIFEKKLKKPVIFFSYPFGAVNDSIEEVVKEAGYESAVGTAYRKG